MAHKHFQLRRISDGLVYDFELLKQPGGTLAYKRSDQDLWVTLRPSLGWVGFDEAHGGVTLRCWDVAPSEQGDHPPEGVWVSRKGAKSYVYQLRYIEIP